MDYIDVKKVLDLSSDCIKSLRVLLDFVQDKDISLYRHVYCCWDKMCNVQSSANRILNNRPICPDRSNCKGWIEGYGCENCRFRPL